MPVHEGSVSSEIAKAVEALDAFGVACETPPMGTVVEADDAAERFAAAAGHDTVHAARVITTPKVDDKRPSDAPASEKVAAVERPLGREASRRPD